MKHLMFLILIFNFGCAVQTKRTPLAPPKLIYSSLCYSNRSKQYTFVEKMNLVNVSKKGINVKIKEEQTPFTIGDTCILERNNIVFKKFEDNNLYHFRCELDFVGDNVIIGKDFRLVKTFNSNIYRLFDEVNKKEVFINKRTCNIVKVATLLEPKDDKQE